MIKKCSCCGGEKINLFAHYKDNVFEGYTISCSDCGLRTDDYELKEQSISIWNNPMYLKEVIK